MGLSRDLPHRQRRHLHLIEAGQRHWCDHPELLSLGIAAKHSRPYHPQTCGKVERFHQTMKKHLTKCAPVETKRQLQAQLDAFVTYYNEIPPHRAIGRRPPLAAFNARERSYPRQPIIDCTGYRVRHDRSTARAWSRCPTRGASTTSGSAPHSRAGGS